MLVGHQHKPGLFAGPGVPSVCPVGVVGSRRLRSSIVTLAPMRQPAQLCRIRRAAVLDPAGHRRPDIPVRQSQQLARRLDAAGHRYG
jgi:hypothetical protein